MTPPPSIDAPILVFDGVCALCNGWVDFLLRRGPASRHRFAAMQGESGRALLAEHGLRQGEHDLKLIMRLCDRIVVLNKGQQIAIGTPDEIRANPAVIDAYIGRKRAAPRPPQTPPAGQIQPAT